MKAISLLALAVGLTLTACRDQATQPVLPAASRTAVVGDPAFAAPKVYYALASGKLTLIWQWGDDQAWDLVSFDLTVNGKAIKGDWNIKPYAQDGGTYPVRSFVWTGSGFGQTLPSVCVSVMAKSQPDKGTPTTTFHSQNCAPVPVPSVRDGPALQPQSIAAAAEFSCGLTYSGEAYCWGYNGYGQLGDGTTTDRWSARHVSGAIAYRQISAGGWELWQAGTVSYPGHACAITSAGAAYCWGDNRYGQLGDGTTTDRHVPTMVSGGFAFAQISVGAGSTCGVTTTGDAYCWGLNTYGQLGDGTMTGRSTPQPVGGGLKFAQISTGGSVPWTEIVAHTCGVTTTGLAYCWGANSMGEIGTGVFPVFPATGVSSPGQVAGGMTFKQISAGGDHTCGVTTTGVGYCWGNGMEGQVGNGVYSAPNASPVAVTGGLAFASITAGALHSCGFTSTGLAYCWGNNHTGQLAASVGYQTAWPAAVYGTFSGTQLSAGLKHTCAVTVIGVPYCWGDDQFGEIGNGQGGPGGVAGIPVRVQANPTFQTLGAGYQHACGLTATGEVYCWGSNGTGQLGDGTTTHRTVATKMEAGLAFTQVSAGELHSCGLGAGGTAFCWGWNHYGQLGDGTTVDHSSPSPIFGHTFASLDVGGEHSCALTSDGAAWCWGYNTNGQLGDGSTTDRSTPTLVAGGHAFQKISAGTSHTCGLTSSGEAYCWGRFGSVESHTAMLVENAPAFTDLTTGDRFTCGLTSTGAAYCWGINLGQLGDGTTNSQYYPTLVLGGHTFKQVSAGSYDTFGVTTANEPFSWGWNLRGELGDGTTTPRLVPNPVSGGFAFEKMSGGGDFACASTTAGVAYCWGANDYGQLGDGTTSAHLTPAPVIAWLIFQT